MLHVSFDNSWLYTIICRSIIYEALHYAVYSSGLSVPLCLLEIFSLALYS